MHASRFARRPLAALTLAVCSSLAAEAGAAEVSRLTPPSELFTSGQSDPLIARFLPGQLFDLQATVKPDAGQTITDFSFLVDGQPVTRRNNPDALARTSIVGEADDAACVDPATGQTTAHSGCKLVAGLPANAVVLTQRAYSKGVAGVHELKISALQSDGKRITAIGNFEIVGIDRDAGKIAKNIIVFLGDGMGASQRTAGRIMAKGYAQGKAKAS